LQKTVWEKAQEVLTQFLAGVTIAEISDQHGLKERLLKMPLEKAI
jgi:Kef-type K+ transport system membrane component KefB